LAVRRSVVGLAASPDGQALDVATNPGDGVPGSITTYSLPGGEPVHSQQGVPGLDKIVARNGGVWELGGTGHTSIVAFAPASALGRLIKEPAGGGGGVFPTFTIADGAGWIGGYVPSCVDPDSGKVLATAALVDHVGRPQASLTGMLATSGGAMYAQYTPLGAPLAGGILRITPPPACAHASH
jgi:hypothetical protein